MLLKADTGLGQLSFPCSGIDCAIKAELKKLGDLVIYRFQEKLIFHRAQ